MNIIKIKYSNEIPKDYTGIVEFEDGEKIWFKNGKLHREDGPANLFKDGLERWLLGGEFIWNSNYKIILTNEIILSKTKHPEYPTVQVWKILNKNEVYERIIIPGMEKCIRE